nr:adhesion G-protein coupled receptor G7-like [Misgurnus anguillicaudatus]
MLLSSETNGSMDIAVSTVATVSQLLSAGQGKFSDVDRDALSKLTQTLQKFSLLNESIKFLVQPNLAVQSFKGKPGTQHVQLTLFKVLMSFNINYQYSEALNWISIIGCSLSILGLAVTAVYQIATRKSRGCSPTLLLVNICVSMMIFYLLFIFGINNPVEHAEVANVSEENLVLVSDYHRYSDEGPCTAFTALIHYFLLATFTWNTLYGINVFLLFKTTTISGTPPWFPKVSLAVGWGFPAIIVGISLGSTYRVENPLDYRQEEL